MKMSRLFSFYGVENRLLLRMIYVLANLFCVIRNNAYCPWVLFSEVIFCTSSFQQSFAARTAASG